MMCLKTNTLTLLSLLLLAGLFILPVKIHAQLSSPDLSFETYGVISSSSTTPFWLQSNRHGMFSSEGSQFLTRIQAHSTNNQLTDDLSFSYGADFIARPGTQSTTSFNQGYLRVDGFGLYLQAGRFHNTSPIHDEELGMGSLGVSGNATPIPQIRAGLADWTSLPFTRDFMQIRGHMAHGWLGSRRLTDNVLYHEKVGHARLGGNFPLNLYGGIAHYAKWGGQHPRFGNMPSTLKDFYRVFIVVGGDENAPPGEQDYMLGDHLGTWDFGLYYESQNSKLVVYRQFPLETKDNLKFKSPQDALTGINLSFEKPILGALKSITYEFLYSKFQDGPTRPNPYTDRDNFRGNENYYNHYLYMTGWTYNRKTIGSPLFIPRESNLGVENNRVVAHHLGVNTEFSNYSIIFKITLSRNYGTWGSGILENIYNVGWGEPYEPRKDQISTQLSVKRKLYLFDYISNISLELFYDNGDLIGNHYGLSSSLQILF